jgi:hypothetical protein
MSKPFWLTTSLDRNSIRDSAEWPFPSNAAGVNRTYLSQLEKGASHPGLEIIPKLPTVLAVEPASCSGGDGAEPDQGGVRRGPSTAHEIRARPTDDPQRQAAQTSSSISAFASFRSAVSKPSVNQP